MKYIALLMIFSHNLLASHAGVELSCSFGVNSLDINDEIHLYLDKTGQYRMLIREVKIVGSYCVDIPVGIKKVTHKNATNENFLVVLNLKNEDILRGPHSENLPDDLSKFNHCNNKGDFKITHEELFNYDHLLFSLVKKESRTYDSVLGKVVKQSKEELVLKGSLSNELNKIDNPKSLQKCVASNEIQNLIVDSPTLALTESSLFKSENTTKVSKKTIKVQPESIREISGSSTVVESMTKLKP